MAALHVSSRLPVVAVLTSINRGLAIESMITLLTIKFVPVFLILWIIGKVIILEHPSSN